MKARTVWRSMSDGVSSPGFFRCCSAAKATNCERSLSYAATVCGEALRFRRRNSRKDRSCSFTEPVLEGSQRTFGGCSLAVGFLGFGPPKGGHCVGRRCRHDAERDVRRLIVARVGVRDVITECTDRGGPRRRRRLLTQHERGGVATGDQARGGGFDVALDT